MLGKVNPEISVVIPAYNEEDNIPELYNDLVYHLDSLAKNWEIIVVDDGSSGSTWSVIQFLNEKDQRVKGIQFSRNFGHQCALYAGLSVARGDAVITMDADLQHPPSVIPKLIKEWEKGYKIVNTLRNDLDSLPRLKKITSRFYYKIFSFLTGVKIEPGMADFRLLDRQVVKEILRFGEESLFLRGIVKWIGFPTQNIQFDCRDRFHGKTKYSLRKMIKFGIAGVTSFSIVPLRVGIVIGIITSFFSFYMIVDSLISYFRGFTVQGWTTTIVVISFMFGILFILIGLIGEYIGRILVQVRGRPRFIIAGVVGDVEPIKNLINSEILNQDFISN